MKKIKNLIFVLLLMTVSVCALSFSAGAGFTGHRYEESFYFCQDEAPEDAPYLVNGKYSGIYRYSFDADTGVLILAPGNEKTKILPRYLIDYARSSDKYYFTGIGIEPDTIRHIIIKDGFTEIYGTFRNLHNLETIILPETLTTIGNEAFYCCESLKNFILPDSVTKIGKNVFSGCKSLTKAYYDGKANLPIPGNTPVPEKVENITIEERRYGGSNIYFYLFWEGDADYYLIYMWDYGAKKWSVIGLTSKVKYYDYECKLVSGQKYRFAVRPYNQIANDISLADYTVATYLHLDPPFIQVKPLHDGYQLTWDEVQGAQGYQIWYSTTKNGQYKFYKNVKGTTFTKTGLKKDQTYYLQIRAYGEVTKGKYQYGSFSNAVETTIGVPSEIILFNLKVHSDDLHNPNAARYIHLTWEGDADYYRIYKWDFNKGEWKIIVDFTKKTSYRYTDNVKLGEKYRFAVRPIMKDGNDLRWNKFISRTIVDLAYIPKLEVTTFEGGYTMTWDKVPGAECYDIYYTKDDYGSFRRYTSVTDNTFTKTGLKKGTSYQLYIVPRAQMPDRRWQYGKHSNTVTITIP
ncbi:MAG: leucine-rich repeat protein [Acutalibacteraceae bacterium]